MLLSNFLNDFYNTVIKVSMDNVKKSMYYGKKLFYGLEKVVL